MCRVIFLVVIFVGANLCGKDDVEESIKKVKYRKNMAFLNFFKLQYYDIANKKLDKLKPLYKQLEADYEVETEKKKKKVLMKKLETIKKQFDINARLVRYYDFSNKKFNFELKGNIRERAKYNKLVYLAQLEYEELTGKKFSDIIQEYNNFLQKKHK